MNLRFESDLSVGQIYLVILVYDKHELCEAKKKNAKSELAFFFSAAHQLGRLVADVRKIICEYA